MLSSLSKKLEKKWWMDFILMAVVTSWHPWAFSQPTLCKSRFMKIFFIVLVILATDLQSFIIVNIIDLIIVSIFLPIVSAGGSGQWLAGGRVVTAKLCMSRTPAVPIGS